MFQAATCPVKRVIVMSMSVINHAPVSRRITGHRYFSIFGESLSVFIVTTFEEVIVNRTLFSVGIKTYYQVTCFCTKPCVNYSYGGQYGIALR